MADKFQQIGFQETPQDQFSGLGFAAQPQMAQQAPQRPDSLTQRLAESAPLQTVLGAGDAMRQALGNILPQSIRPQYRPVGTPGRLPYTIGRGIGDIGTFMAAAPIGGEALRAAEVLPSVGKTAEWLGGKGISKITEEMPKIQAAIQRYAPGMARRVGGTALYGAATDPNRMAGLGMGTLAGGIGEGLPVAGKIAKALSPQKLTDSIMHSLSAGRGVEENSKSLASDIKKAYKQNKDQASAMYDPFFKQAGNANIYKAVRGSAISPVASYKNMPNFEDVTNSYLPNTKQIHDSFMENPTIKNAHNLQSQLGADIRKISGSPQDIQSMIRLQNYSNARESLQNDAWLHLLGKDPTGNLAQQYDDATNFYRNKIAPYKSTRSLMNVATGKTTNPKNITSIFKNPDANIQSVVGDLGPSGNKKILYSEIGKRINMTPEKLQTEVSNLDKKGLSSYITPDLEQNLDKLGVRTKARESLQRIAGFGAGMAVPAMLGAKGGLTEQILGGLGGAAVSPTAARIAQRILPQRLGVYPVLRQALTGLYLGGQ